MLMGLLPGLPVMVRHHYLVNSPSFVARLIVINGVMLLLVIPMIHVPDLFRVRVACLNASLVIHDVLHRLSAPHPYLSSTNPL